MWSLWHTFKQYPKGIHQDYILRYVVPLYSHLSQEVGFPCGSAGKESACNAGDLGSIPGLGRSPGEGKGYPLQYSGLENSMDCIVHGVLKSWTRLSNFHKIIQFPKDNALPEAVLSTLFLLKLGLRFYHL